MKTETESEDETKSGTESEDETRSGTESEDETKTETESEDETKSGAESETKSETQNAEKKQSKVGEETENTKKVQSCKVKRGLFTEKEITMIRDYFRRDIKKRKTPAMSECSKFLHLHKMQITCKQLQDQVMTVKVRCLVYHLHLNVNRLDTPVIYVNCTWQYQDYHSNDQVSHIA